MPHYYHRGETTRTINHLNTAAQLENPYELVPSQLDVPVIIHKIGDQTPDITAKQRHVEAELGIPVTRPTHAMEWLDSNNNHRFGFFTSESQGGLGPLLPIAGQEAVNIMSTGFTRQEFIEATAHLSPEQQANLIQTTTDREPAKILEVGNEATLRVLAQQALDPNLLRYVNETRGERTPTQRFLEIIASSNIMWQPRHLLGWGVQADTYKAYLAPGTLEIIDAQPRYTRESTKALRQHKLQQLDYAEKQTLAVYELVRARTTDEETAVQEAIDLLFTQYKIPPFYSRRFIANSEQSGDAILQGCLSSLEVARSTARLVTGLTGAVLNNITLREVESLGKGYYSELLDDGRYRTTAAVFLSCMNCANYVNSSKLLPQHIGKNIEPYRTREVTDLTSGEIKHVTDTSASYADKQPGKTGTVTIVHSLPVERAMSVLHHVITTELPGVKNDRTYNMAYKPEQN
jgi:transcription termination factor NusB